MYALCLTVSAVQKKKNTIHLDRPMGIRMKTQLMTMETDILIVFAEGTEVCKCESL